MPLCSNLLVIAISGILAAVLTQFAIDTADLVFKTDLAGVQETELSHTLREFYLRNPPPVLASNPYKDPSVVVKDNDETVCGAIIDSDKLEYTLQTFDNVSAAERVGAAVTHKGPCGLCSSFADLAVYLERTDLTTPTRRCGYRSFLSKEWTIDCLRKMGFTESCASIWYYNIKNTGEVCLTSCLSNIFTPNNNADGSLSPCIQCDETNSGPVFKFVSGRTRRNSGIVSAIQRNPDEVFNIAHEKYIANKGGKLPKKWEAPGYGKLVVAGLRRKVLENKFDRITKDPYSDPDFDTTIDPFEVCGIKYTEPSHLRYKLHTYPTAEAATKDGAIITHRGGCGVCSTLQDLAVYIGQRDLTTPVRRCGFKSFLDKKWAMQCLHDIGFSEPCADIWYYNTQNTRKKCLTKCFFSFLQSNNYRDGSLSSCIGCDERISGPVFKKASARTRRNSGLTSAIGRPGPAVYRVEHMHHTCAADDHDDDVCENNDAYLAEVLNPVDPQEADEVGL